ncbi:phytoene/squalene synthase family protein [Latilactobacillus fragifolii]|uniref:phytoene/squalene synthase family protein n=1 Tax=Latilactobacillus fragifolii TaxID=2814244 RepID=UPI001ABA97F2|nr:phytoene/squalene synthase family protein [Latilactobacillus fragifolii]
MTGLDPQSFESRQEDFKFCENIIKKHSQSFYTAFSQLPKTKAQSVYAIYAFCRVADDAIDEEGAIQKIIALEEQLTLFKNNKQPDTPIWRALSVVFSHYSLDTQYFQDMLIGQKMDYQFEQPTSYQQLLDYAYYVASSVGLMLLPILASRYSKIKVQAKQLGQAMQITNILRDVGEDLQNNRIYLPKEEMQAYSVTPKMLAEGKVTTHFIELWESLARRAEALYTSSLSMMALVDEDAQKALLSAVVIYRELLNEIRRNHYDVFSKRQSVSKRRKLALLKKYQII